MLLQLFNELEWGGYIKIQKRKLKRIIALSILFIVVFGIILQFMRYFMANKLVNAIEKNDTKKVESLLKSGVNPNVGTLPDYGIHRVFRIMTETSPQYPLAEACRQGNYEIVKLLIDHGAKVDFSKKEVWSPLWKAIQRYKPDTIPIVKLLLENGADIYHEEGGEFPAQIASQMRPKKYDPERKNGTVFEDGYDEETAQGITEVVKLLIGDNDINEPAYCGRTMLMWAAFYENIPLTEYLLSIGANKSIKNHYDGKTAYDYAIDNDNQKLAELLKPSAEI